MTDTPFVKDTKTLTLAGGLAVLTAAIAEAERIGQPVCISVVDTISQWLGRVPRR
jgi:glc operon protein GlcG